MITPTSFRVRNLRSLQDSGQIQLKPITVLVGRNSTGKSTFARLFPLLRQSAEAAKRGPLLWWGRLVDFGSFEQSVNRLSEKKNIGLDFSVSFDEESLTTRMRKAYGRLSILRALEPGEIDVSLEFDQTSSGLTYTSSITLKLFDFTAAIFLDSDGFTKEIKCGLFSWKPTATTVCYAAQDSLIPNPAFFKAAGGPQGSGNWESYDPIRLELQKAIRPFVHGNTTEDKIRQLSYRIPIGTRSAIYSELLRTANPPSFRENLQYSGPESEVFKRLCDISFASQLDVIIEKTANAIASFSSEVIYLEPLRATAQRYYRQQSLAVGEIDSKGENIAMFLDSLSPSSMKAFQEWTLAHFGIIVSPRKEGGHISLTIKQSNDGAETNIADMGFGFSQMLPIAAQLWAASAEKTLFRVSRRQGSMPLIVMEQPELHLHPEYQARLADVFVAAINRTAQNGIRIIAETHSHSLINRLGALVADSIISRDAIQIVLFEQDDNLSRSTTRVAEFDDEGILQNWPTGFFQTA